MALRIFEVDLGWVGVRLYLEMKLTSIVQEASLMDLLKQSRTIAGMCMCAFSLRAFESLQCGNREDPMPMFWFSNY